MFAVFCVFLIYSTKNVQSIVLKSLKIILFSMGNATDLVYS